VTPATGSAQIIGSGNVLLGQANPTVTVNDGPMDSDLIVNVPLTGGPALTKDGLGRLELGAANTYGLTTSRRAMSRFDAPSGSIGNVVLNGAVGANPTPSVSGKGDRRRHHHGQRHRHRHGQPRLQCQPRAE